MTSSESSSKRQVNLSGRVSPTIAERSQTPPLVPGVFCPMLRPSAPVIALSSLGALSLLLASGASGAPGTGAPADGTTALFGATVIDPLGEPIADGVVVL